MKRQTMVGKLFIVMIAALGFNSSEGLCQNALSPGTDTSGMAWLKELYQPGVSMEGDSLVINAEAELLLKDESYRATMYPKVYTWQSAADFIKKQEIKKATWYFINLYINDDKNKETVIKSLVVYNKFFKMDKVLMSSFYTYSFTDPEIGKIENGHSEITAPHIMEKKLNALKAMLFYLDKYKLAETKQENKKD